MRYDKPDRITWWDRLAAGVVAWFAYGLVLVFLELLAPSTPLVRRLFGGVVFGIGMLVGPELLRDRGR